MRAAFLALVLTAIVLVSPPVTVGKEEPAPVASFAEVGPVLPHWYGPPPGLGAAGAASLVFAVPPRQGNMPILPDLPLPLPAMAPDGLPASLSAATEPAFVSFLSGRVPSYGPNHRQVTSALLNLRTGPSQQFPTATTLRRGDIAEVIGLERAGWVPVRLAKTGAKGWVYRRYLALLRG